MSAEPVVAVPVKDLKYYLAHTDEMPDDPKVIEQLAEDLRNQAIDGGTEQMNIDTIVGKPDEPAASSPAPAEEVVPKEPAVAKPVEPTPAVPAAEAKPVLLAKDGVHTIPYAQLESARDRAAAAERVAAEQAAEIERLRAGHVAPANQPSVQLLSAQELADLETELPTLAKVLKNQQGFLNAQQQTINELRGTVTQLTNRADAEIAAEHTEVKSEIQQAIDANATLAEWQTAEDQTLWSRASAIDRTLRELPEFRNTSFEDRFNKVVELTQSALGLKPEPAQSAPAPSQEAPATPALTQAEIRAAAEAKLKAKPNVPVSLSQIPGGAPPAQDERERLEQMSSVEIGSKFQSMTREQLDAYLNTM